MEPHQLRLTILAAISLLLVIFLTVGFGAMTHVKVDIKSKTIFSIQPIYCYKYQYGYFRYCYRKCDSSTFSGESDDKCGTIDYDQLDAGSTERPENPHDSSSAKGYVVMAAISYVAVLGCLFFIFVVKIRFTVPSIYVYIACIGLGVASIIGIAMDSSLSGQINDTWEQHKELKSVQIEGGQGVDSIYTFTMNMSKGWAFFIYVGASVVMVIHACVLAFFTRRDAQQEQYQSLQAAP